MTPVGFIGLGLIGKRRFQIVRDMGQPTVFAVDPDSRRYEQFEIGDCRFVQTIGQLDDNLINTAKALFVAVPHNLAAGYCRWAIERGMHVLCEKPMGITSVEAETLRRLANQAGVRFCAGFNYRFMPGIAELRELLRSKKFGTLHHVRMAIGHGGRPGMESEWKLQKAKAGGGALIDPGIHLIDLIRDLFGEPMIVSSQLKRLYWPSDVEDNCFVIFQVGDIDVTMEVSLTNWKNRFLIEVYGSDGQVAITGRGGNYGPQRLEFVNRWFWKEDRRFERDYGNSDPSFERETRAFIESVTLPSSDPVLSDATDGYTALKIVEEIYSKANKAL